MILSRQQSILRTVIRRGFPELRAIKIALQFGVYDCWMFYEPAGRRQFLLGVDVSLASAPRRILEGGFAHELAHIVRDNAYSAGQLELAFERYRTSLAWRIREEREADLEAIRRGFGPQLLALMGYARRRGYVSCREHGMLPGEVYRLL